MLIVRSFVAVVPLECKIKAVRIVLSTRLTDRISNSRLYEKFGSIPLFRAIMKEAEMARPRSVDEG